MFTIGQKVLGYISGSAVNSELKLNKCDRPSLEDFISVSNFEREKFDGVVTTINERDIVVNDDIYFSIPFSQLKGKFKVGDSVQGIAERKTKHEAWQAVSLSHSLAEAGWDAEQPKVASQAIPCRDLDAGIPGILKNDLFPPRGSKPLLKISATRAKQLSDEAETETQTTIFGKVERLLNDDVTLNENMYFRMSAATISYEICIGDWIICKLADNPRKDVQQENDNLAGFINVTQVDPLRKKKIKGEVTHVYPTHFVINKEVYCSRRLTREIQLLRYGDNVVVDIIESDQEQFCWRAISVSNAATPVIKDLRIDIANKLRGLGEGVKTPNLLEDKHNISISHSLRFPQVFIGSQSHLTVFIINNGEEACSLFRVYFVSASLESQFSVLSESSDGVINESPVKMMPSKGLYIKLACTGKLLGNCRQLCIFDFGDFHIGRYVTAAVEDQRMMCLAPTTPYYHHGKRELKSIEPRDSRIIRGERPFKAPAFLPLSLPAYHVPSPFWDAAESMEKVLTLAPFLREPGTRENYQDRYSALLHLEEVEMTSQMRQFDMTRTAFTSHGEYLSLAVPGLAEKRPSLMIGDTVIASNPCNLGGTEYEGYIHEVLYNQVLLKFHPSFHEQYRCEDYAIRFNFNRTPLRRCHFALQFSMQQLGADILFPSKLKFQLPQVCYVDPETFSLNANRRTTIDALSGLSFCQEENSCSGGQLGKFKRKEKCFDANDKQSKYSHRDGKDYGENHQLSAAESFNFLSGVKGVKSAESFTSSTIDGDEGKVMGRKAADANCSVMNCNVDAIGDIKVNDRSSDKLQVKEVHLKKMDIDAKSDRDESVDEDRMKDCSKIESLPNSTRTVAKRNVNTPPRIPVVTRLFGIPSSGSSANSSICCSDDESKSNSEIEWETRVKKNLYEKKVPYEVKSTVNVVSIRKNLNGKVVESENHTSGTVGESHLALERSPSTVKKNGNCNFESSNGDCYKVIKEENQLDECTNPLQISLGSDKYAKTESNSSDRNVGNESGSTNTVGKESVNGKESVKSKYHLKDLEDKFNELFGKDCKSRDKTQCKCGICHQLENQSQLNYCVPVLPLKSSIDKRIKNKEIPLLKWFNKKLNLEQKMAVRRILEGSTRPLPYVIYGPPGTGKTITVVETILQIFTLVHHSRLLIVTPSNSAADLVTERLLLFDRLKKADLVRLNAYQRKEESIPENIRSYCCNGDQLPVRVRQRVIITTATTAGLLYTLGLHNGHFTHILVDEAGQLTVPECLVALGLVNSVSGQIVLAGDPQQLGPVIQSRLAKDLGLQESLLHHLCNTVLYQPEEINDSSAWIYEPRLLTQLVKNYRSHPDVISVPSKLFYHDTLVSHASSEIKEKLLRWDELPNSNCPLVFHGLVSENLQEGDSPSWFNPTEAFQVVRYTKSLIKFGLEPVNIGIITPYRKQVQKIRQLLVTFGIEDGIKVGTVEEFQGQERVVIIISTVRSSEQLLEVDVQHSLGFVKCRRRFNVAVTRAQSLLVVVGNPLLLMLDNCWLSFISFCISKRAYRGPELQFGDQNDFD